MAATNEALRQIERFLQSMSKITGGLGGMEAASRFKPLRSSHGYYSSQINKLVEQLSICRYWSEIRAASGIHILNMPLECKGCRFYFRSKENVRYCLKNVLRLRIRSSARSTSNPKAE